MLSPDFAAEIGRVDSRENVTAILNWRAPAHLGAFAGAIPHAKQTVIDDLGLIDGVQINPLPGFPQLIVVAPAGVWQSFIRQNAWLRNSDQVEVVGNSSVFRTMS
ncbi:MAG: hypothetical protein WCF81_17280 [Roseiarcus sp.]